jgi:hypothetical protein
MLDAVNAAIARLRER